MKIQLTLIKLSTAQNAIGTLVVSLRKEEAIKLGFFALSFRCWADFAFCRSIVTCA